MGKPVYVVNKFTSHDDACAVGVYSDRAIAEQVAEVHGGWVDEVLLNDVPDRVQRGLKVYKILVVAVDGHAEHRYASTHLVPIDIPESVTDVGEQWFPPGAINQTKAPSLEIIAEAKDPEAALERARVLWSEWKARGGE